MAMMTVPNIITLLRIALVPWLVVLVVRGNYGTVLWVFLLAGTSDALDGYIARRFNQMSRLGSFLDPLADKIMLVSLFICLAVIGLMPRWLAAAVVARDLVILAGAAYWFARTGGIEMEPTKLSKLNTGVLVSVVLLVVADAAGLVALAPVRGVLHAVALASVAASGLQYVGIWSSRLKRFLQGEST
jgi:cardiolipin synthase